MSLGHWAIDVEKEVIKREDISKDLELRKKRCIYRVPDYIRELDNKACEPQVVSFGPYHHGEPNLEPMEMRKLHALSRFLKRSMKGLHEYLDALAQEGNDLEGAYDHKLDLSADEFLKMMIYDGCFILEILRTAPGDYSAANDHMIYLNEMPLIKRDMLLLENQLPLRVLEILVVVEGMGADKHAVINSILRFFGLDIQRSQSMDKQQGGMHILDVCRRGLVVGPHRIDGKIVGEHRLYHDIDIPSATELHEVGIRFKTSKTTNLNDITFKGSTLRFPPIMVTDDTKSFFLNLMAFERVHAGAENEVTSYFFFMGCLLKSDRDASLLRSLGFVPSALGSDEDVAQLVRLISKKAMFHPDQRELVEVLVSVTNKLRNRVRTRLSAWRMDLLQNYLKSPWGVVSVIAAIILFTLTTIQTVYSVLSYIHRKD